MNLVYADSNGNVYDHPGYTALARNAEMITEILDHELIPLPDGATLVSLPGTLPIGIDQDTGRMERVEGDHCAVGALLPQGYTRLLLPSYVKIDANQAFPIFGYTAVVWKDGNFYVAAELTDNPYYWNPLHCDVNKLQKQVNKMISRYPDNRVYQHLSKCALEYECLTASNTFLQRWEGGVPVSFSCNASCFGCISEQPEDSLFVAPQTRMKFKPKVEELVEIMLEHLVTPDSMISFGQGCEGEPSTQAALIIEAIRRVRQCTELGYININTNGGLTDQIRNIVDEGLDLMRVSTISAIDEHYQAYYQPKGYTLQNVEKSIRYATDQGVLTSINYLVFPGVSDREEEIEAMIEFARRSGLQYIQLRNLNIDPESYLKIIPKPRGDVMGMSQMLAIYRQEIPHIVIGSYTHTPEFFKHRREKSISNHL